MHAALIDYLKQAVLTPAVLETLVSAIRDEVAKLLSVGSKDVTGLEKDLASLRAEQQRLARAVAEIRFVTDRIVVVSGDDGDVWWLFRGDDGKWLFLEQGQWEDLDPSARAWNRDVRLGLVGYQLVVSIVSDGPPVAVERRDLQPPDYVPTPDSLFWSPPDDQDRPSVVLATDPTLRMRTLK